MMLLLYKRNETLWYVLLENNQPFWYKNRNNSAFFCQAASNHPVIACFPAQHIPSILFLTHHVLWNFAEVLYMIPKGQTAIQNRLWHNSDKATMPRNSSCWHKEAFVQTGSFNIDFKYSLAFVILFSFEMDVESH